MRACVWAALTVNVLFVIAVVVFFLDGLDVIPSWHMPLSFYAFVITALGLARVVLVLATNWLLEKIVSGPEIVTDHE